MRTILYNHNKTAYQKVMKAFETSDRTCVVHPTGTGKSFLMAAVSESFKRVLILGPNTFVLDQVHGVLAWRDNGKEIKEYGPAPEYMTYTLLMYKVEVPTGYDLICLDEFHRAGAPEWGEAVDRLLEKNPQAKVLGTTATPIRFLDDNRDMADELFGGNVASFMTLRDAFNQGILVTPRFVTGLFDFDKITADMENRIRKSQRIEKDDKKQRIARIKKLRLEWERSQGMPQILRKHISKSVRRIIVFCSSVEHMKDMEQTVCEWFHKADIKVADVYTVHAYMTDSDLKSAMDGFESDNFGDGGVKLMMSVNLLNEGVHIPRVNAVILLRSTESKNIYLQQIGRCLTAEKKDRPVILDMVDNITTTNIVHDIRESLGWQERGDINKQENESCEMKDFVVHDYTLSIQQAMEKLVPENMHMGYKKRMFMLSAFCEANGRLPLSKDGYDYKNFVTLKRSYYYSEELQDLLEKYNRDTFIDTETRMARLLKFVEKNDRLPKGRKAHENIDYINYTILCKRDKKHPNEQLRKLRDKYKIEKLSNEELLHRFLSYVNEKGHLPAKDSSTLEERRLDREVRKRLRRHPSVIAVWEKYGYRRCINFDDRMEQLKVFVNEHGRFPDVKDGDEYDNYLQIRRRNRRNKDITI